MDVKSPSVLECLHTGTSPGGTRLCDTHTGEVKKLSTLSLPEWLVNILVPFQELLH